MPRARRQDAPGTLHHIGNRGHDRRNILETERDRGFFLSLLADAVFDGRIQVHAYVLMCNHFHLLVESVDGDISATMHWIETCYAAYFNRTREHTGYVFGSRFWSSPVRSLAYLIVLFRYFGRNPVKVSPGLDPLEFRAGSAYWHARPGKGPRWLAHSLLDRLLKPRMLHGQSRTAACRKIYGGGAGGEVGCDLVERRLAHPSEEFDDLDLLLTTDDATILGWLVQQAHRFGRGAGGLPMAGAGVIVTAMEMVSREAAETDAEFRDARRRPWWRAATVGLLFDLGALLNGEVSETMGLSAPSIRAAYSDHVTALDEDPVYGARLVKIVRRVVAETVGEAACYAAEKGDLWPQNVRRPRASGE